jgi:nitronate monooxygenase
MLRTRFTDLVGCTVPIQQAGMGSLAHPQLAAAVSNAGALGMVSVAGLPPTLLTEILDKLQRDTKHPFGCNFLLPFVGDEVRECVAIAASRARVIDFFWGEPDRSLVEIVHDEGALACWQVGSRDEAVAAAKAGCDLIVAQGIEAGGHVRGRISLIALLDEVLEAVEVPIIAAGGIGTGRAMAAVLAAGADAVRVGTRFVAAVEAEAHEQYVSALIKAEAADTVYTEAFSVGWPDAPHRVLRSSLQAAEAQRDEIIGERVGRYTGKKFPVRRFEIGVPLATTIGAIEAMPHWAGESVVGVKRVQPVADIVRELSGEAEELLKRWC